MRQKTVTVKQIQRLDKIAITQYGIPSLVLMENAGRLVSEHIFGKIKRVKSPKVCIICGLGNNAGDGFVIARHLLEKGIKTSIYLIGHGTKLKNDARVNYQILKKLKHPIKAIKTANTAFLKDVRQANIVVDAIFGVGLNRDIKDPFQSIIEAINANSRTIVAVDIPSGLDGTTGKTYGICVKANTTVTFSFMKKGFVRNAGPKHVGKVFVADIGIPKIIKNKIM